MNDITMDGEDMMRSNEGRTCWYNGMRSECEKCREMAEVVTDGTKEWASCGKCKLVWYVKPEDPEDHRKYA